MMKASYHKITKPLITMLLFSEYYVHLKHN